MKIPHRGECHRICYNTKETDEASEYDKNMTEEENFMVEHVLNLGARILDEDANFYVLSQKQIVEFARARQKTSEEKVKKLEEKVEDQRDTISSMRLMYNTSYGKNPVEVKPPEYDINSHCKSSVQHSMDLADKLREENELLKENVDKLKWVSSMSYGLPKNQDSGLKCFTVEELRQLMRPEVTT
tara:strand:- start:443 stop:997 length:555 start_codon:yes stop_codon:yes gene_type:complete